MDDDLREIIGRLRRSQPRNEDVAAVCEALEKYLGREGKAKFDKVAYQREYMRRWRASKREHQF